MKKLVIFILCVLSVSISYAQERGALSIETVSASAIDRLILGNSRVSGQMNSDQRAVVGLLSDILRTAGQRKHDLNARNQTTVNVAGGEQAQFFEKDGNYFIFYKGKVHQISNDLVNKAKEENAFLNANKIGSLPTYDWTLIQKNFIPKRKDTAYFYFLSHKEETLDYIAKKNNCSIYNITFKPVFLQKGKWYYQQGITYFESWAFKSLTEKGKPLKQDGEISPGKYYAKVPQFGFPFPMEIKIAYSFYPSLVNHLLTYRWNKDFNGNNRKDLDELKGLSRSFYDNEFFHISWGYQSEYQNTSWELYIYDEFGGLIEYQKGKNSEKVSEDEHEISPNSLSPGKYVISFQIKDNFIGKIVLSASEDFEILPSANE